MAESFGGHYKLDQNQVDRMRLLRSRDPEIWTFRALAVEFQTTTGNVSKIINRRNRKERVDIYRDGVSLDKYHGTES
jgi:hypothetical protein